jgi:hypothetical protein
MVDSLMKVSSIDFFLMSGVSLHMLHFFYYPACIRRRITIACPKMMLEYDSLTLVIVTPFL